jgi:glutathione S-transferase
LHKQLPFTLTYIDLAAPPEWFALISPLGQVPLLKVNHDVLFESSVIQDYVDEISPQSLYPQDALLKAKNRAWMSFGSELLGVLFQAQMAQEESIFNAHWAELNKRLARLDEAHCGASFFNGEQFSMIDASLAPLLMRLELIGRLTGHDALAQTPRLSAWWKHLQQVEAVKHSVVEDFETLFGGMLRAKSRFLFPG